MIRELWANRSISYLHDSLRYGIRDQFDYLHYQVPIFYRSNRQSLFRNIYDTYFCGYDEDDFVKDWRKYKSNEEYEIYSLCCSFFAKYGKKIATIFISEKYGCFEEAVISTKKFVVLLKEFDFWFEERRRKFMEGMELEIAKANILSQQKCNGQHGSVASLLKVLTKTMTLQGSDIRNIAKMQYMICTQAGIYIPDEFITDVAVFSDCEQEYVSAKDKIIEERENDKKEVEIRIKINESAITHDYSDLDKNFKIS